MPENTYHTIVVSKMTIFLFPLLSQELLVLIPTPFVLTELDGPVLTTLDGSVPDINLSD